jgi:hypothetical protein
MPTAVIDTASSGDNTIVAAKTGYTVRVTGYELVVAGAVTVQWFSDTGSGKVKLSGAMSFAANGGVTVAPMPPSGSGAPMSHFDTAAGKALNLNLGGPVQVSGHLTYFYQAA